MGGHEACFHYVSVGDFRLCVKLTQYFAALNRDVDVKLVPLDLGFHNPNNLWDELKLPQCSNLIVIGNPRVSHFIAHQMEEIRPNFTILPGDSTTTIAV